VLFFLSTFLTTLCAMLSWRYIEKPCMRLKNTFLSSSVTNKDNDSSCYLAQLQTENKKLRAQIDILKIELSLKRQ
ncbi:hypothetical protein, partial [Photobacterium sp. BZF1]|uniref:hypothetical protein n=1 Tax=Photobacterium sp. BZF1 TaxID=1904457 RepID=UPI001CA3910B